MLEHKEIKKGKNNKPARQHFILDVKDYLDLNYEFRRNDLTMEIEVKPLDEDTFKVVDESILNSIWIQLQLDGFKIAEKLFPKILNSDLFRSYNPLSEYINTLPKCDGKTDYIGQLAKTVTMSKININSINEQDLWRSFLEKWLVGSVATALGKGVNHLCLILVGGQGIGKTTWLNKLCPEPLKDFLVCSHINPSLTDTNTCNFLAEKWFVNIDDQLETIFGKDFNSMKAIITAPFVTNRKTWHRLTKKRKRVCSFMGSVNNPKFLTDAENRRYLVFTAKDINYCHEVDMAKVWAQAHSLLTNGYNYWFTTEEMKQLNKVNEIYRQVSLEEEWLMKLYDKCEPSNSKAVFAMPSEILTRLNAFSGLKLSQKKLCVAMDRLGYSKISKRVNGQPRNVFPVIERSDYEEKEYQSQLRKEIEKDQS
ncbi:MAG: hypothetical protein COC01_08600 [Bacteroidetes bacterium]|nr:MAG: hypothetical protein COC01_08600 [Bacteroidota bacterium]